MTDATAKMVRMLVDRVQAINELKLGEHPDYFLPGGAFEHEFAAAQQIECADLPLTLQVGASCSVIVLCCQMLHALDRLDPLGTADA